ncbi:MAG: SpoIID/LytB domain-containing protein [Gemmatimonadota bacterium]
MNGSRPDRRLSLRSALVLPAAAFVVAATLGASRAPRPAGPPIRVGLAVAADTALRLASADGLVVTDAQSGAKLFEAAPGVPVRIERRGPMAVAVAGRNDERGESVAIRVAPAGDAPVNFGGASYRGVVDVYAVEEAGLNAVNELPLEDYLLGVVPIEIGPRGESELAAVAAQAVAARTYAVAHLRAREEMGFDVFGSVEDQAYGGMAAERPESTRAVQETAGRILMYDGLPIRAMYHSTCGGRTAPVEEVLDRTPAPYLQSVSDRAPDGTDYCAASPRYRWVEEISPADLNGRIRAQMRRIFGARPEDTGDILGLRIAARTPTGRVEGIAVRGERAEFVLERLDIRIALADAAGRILGSTDFDVVIRPDDVVELHGRGFGHGSGMCQWGAIGRAKAGQDWESILQTYYPGAELVSVY